MSKPVSAGKPVLRKELATHSVWASSNLVSLLIPYLVLVIIHFASGAPAEQPIILADELGYLGNARYLAGAGPLPNMYASQFYHFGYSLLLLPAFWLFEEPLTVYRAVIIINAFLASALFFPLSYAMVFVFQIPKRSARTVAFACCLYPSVILYSSFAWAENAFIPMYAAAVALFGKLLVSRSARDALVFGLVVGALYAVHPRALPVLAIVFVYLVALALFKILPRLPIVLSIAAMGAVFAGTRVLNAHLKAIGWGGGGEFSATKLAARLVPGSDFPLLLERASGQILYLFQASHGLSFLGLFAVMTLIIRHLIDEGPRRALATPRTSVCLFVLLTATGIFIASCTSKLYSIHGAEAVRGADFLYGRYNECFAVVLVGIALAELFRKDFPKRRLLFAGLGLVVTTLALTTLVAVEIEDALRRHDPTLAEEEARTEILPDEIAPGALPGVFPVIGFVGKMDLYTMSLISLGLFAAVTAISARSASAGAAALIGLFVTFAVENHRQYLLPAIAEARPRLDFVEHLGRIGSIETLGYDVAHYHSELYFGTQYLLPKTHFVRFDSSRGQLPETEAVISGNRWRQARKLKAKFVLSSGWDNALWVLPGPLQAIVPTASFRGMALGAEPKVGVQESGFHLAEDFFGAPGRWTKGYAFVKVRFESEDAPRRLALDTLAPGRDDARLRLLANGIELSNGPLPSDGWSRIFSLEKVPMTNELIIELLSNAQDGPRRIGVVVRGMRLFAEDEAAFEGVRLGAEPMVGFQESGFYSPERIESVSARWTDGAAKLVVPVPEEGAPRWLRIETLAPGRNQVQLRLSANGVALWDGEIPAESWSQRFDLADVPMRASLLLEINSDTFSPSEEGSVDPRQLGVAIRSITLTASDILDEP